MIIETDAAGTYKLDRRQSLLSDAEPEASSLDDSYDSEDSDNDTVKMCTDGEEAEDADDTNASADEQPENSKEVSNEDYRWQFSHH